MRQWQLPKEGCGIDNLKLVSGVPIPTPKGSELLIKMKALSINHRDILLSTQANFGTDPNVVFLSDGAGEVVAVGPEAKRFAVGDRVAMTFMKDSVSSGCVEGPAIPDTLGATVPGCATEYMITPDVDAVKIPDSMTYEEAAVLPCAGPTAWAALNAGAEGLRPGSTVLIQGTGGVSILAAQIAKASGCRVIGTSSSDAKLEHLVQLGLVAKEDCINYRTTPNWGQAALARTTDGRGVDIVVDVVGPKTLNEAVKCIRRHGLISCVGMQDLSQHPDGFPFLPFLLKRVRLVAELVGPRVDFEHLMDLFESANVHPVFDKHTFSFEELREALHYLKSATHFGKIVIRV